MKRGGRTREAVVDTADETRREMHYQAPRYALVALSVYAASFEHAQMGSYPRQSAKRMHIDIDLRRFHRPNFALTRTLVWMCTTDSSTATGTNFSYLSLDVSLDVYTLIVGAGTRGCLSESQEMIINLSDSWVQTVNESSSHDFAYINCYIRISELAERHLFAGEQSRSG